jgi:hypothetical protein
MFIAADPQINPGTEGQLLTLEGVSDRFPVKLEDGKGLALREGKKITLTAGVIISFVFDSVKNLWVETSRSDFYNNTIKGRYI